MSAGNFTDEFTQFGPKRQRARAIDRDPSAGWLHQGAQPRRCRQTPYTWPQPANARSEQSSCQGAIHIA